MTLAFGVEKVLKESIPEVSKIQPAKGVPIGLRQRRWQGPKTTRVSLATALRGLRRIHNPGPSNFSNRWQTS
jgi:hypothetical protein